MYDVRAKKASLNLMQFVVHFFCDEKQPISTEALQACRLAITKYSSKDVGHNGHHILLHGGPEGQ